MHKAKEWLLEKHGLWFSLLCHLLLLISFTLVWHPFSNIKPEPKPQMYIPSYTYEEPTRVIQQQQKTLTTPSKTEKVTTSPDGLLKNPSPVEPATSGNATPTVSAKQQSKNSQGVHLIGDDKNTPKPLIKLLAKDLSAHLIYPKIAADFKVHGTTYVGFTLHPDGSLTDIRLMQTSKASVLDQASLAAVNAMSPGMEVGKYLKEPKFLVVGIIFG